MVCWQDTDELVMMQDTTVPTHAKDVVAALSAEGKHQDALDYAGTLGALALEQVRWEQFLFPPPFCAERVTFH